MLAAPTMTPADAMKNGPVGLEIYADWLAEHGQEAEAATMRANAWAARAAEAACGVEVHPTGSRLYGSYATHHSDWDWYCLVADPNTPARSLELAGWKDGGGSAKSERAHSISMYFGKTNVVIFGKLDAYERFRDATIYCLHDQPTTRKEAVKIFKGQKASKEDAKTI